MQQDPNQQKGKSIRSEQRGWKRIISVVILLATFFLFFGFYLKISPLVPLDTDDWYYMGYFRHPIPLWGNWNPSRVLPEIFMPNVSIFAALVVYPILGDYINSMTFVYAVVMAIFLTILLYRLYKLLYKHSGSNLYSLILVLFWVVIHFTLMVKGSSGNYWLWRSGSANCYFFYTIPALLNESIVLYCIYHDNQYSRFSLFVLLILGYFGIFSNLFPAIILPAYGGVQIMFALIDLVRDRSKLKEFIKRQFYNIYISFMFMVSAVFELSGGRASGYPGFRFRETIGYLIKTIADFNKCSLLSIAVLVIISAALLWKRHQNLLKHDLSQIEVCMKSTLSFAIVLILEVLVSAKSDASYIARDDVQIAVVFYLLLAIFIFIASAYKEFTKKIAYTILCIAISMNCVVLLGYNKDFYAVTNRAGFSPELCKKVDEDIMSQIISAADRGDQNVVVYVPAFPDGKNWPIATYAGGWSYYSNTLWKHRLTAYPVYVTIQPTESKNREFGF